jgi:type II secretory pathway pseudopilin PulG
MRRPTTSSGAFTLVELLCVIAILVLLITLLVPALSGARELAERAKCMDNYRQIGAALHGFAAAHMERGPGQAYRFRYPDRAYWTVLSEANQALGSEGWKGMLESEYFLTRPNTIPKFPCWLPMSRTPNNSIGYSSDLQTRRQQFACPSARVTGNNYCVREMGVFDGGAPYGGFTGGARAGFNALDDSNSPLEGPYGFRVNPAPAPWSFYSLGPRYASFPNPGVQFAVWEWCYASDSTCQAVVGADPPADNVYYEGSRLTWVGHNGGYAFRHHNLTGVYLYYDGHADVKSSTDPVMGMVRYAYRMN